MLKYVLASLLSVNVALASHVDILGKPIVYNGQWACNDEVVARSVFQLNKDGKSPEEVQVMLSKYNKIPSESQSLPYTCAPLRGVGVLVDVVDSFIVTDVEVSLVRINFMDGTVWYGVFASKMRST